ncbi:prephenate/arogenate dehydrogenase family protein [Aquibaculum arenosum]|uniref:Prephenate/arogenate dehydrogenase family protein n=1 Tax=Aquibaculum arenosum TaxID=3032591 RepID=A0ABT5YNS8_9PROT|nr:prephenate/arogenate dehydrogenase family protein [Fodinicurvata sp. CAU 1616]MDF2095889.1 prephenate/arogenate dehydrogenase family protein [Fodinicurvata sp. CAU 1616]
MSRAPFHRVAVLGIGLIGSSLARVMRTRGLAEEIIGFDGAEAVRERSVALGLCDRLTDSPADAVAGADLVMLCLPVGANATVAEAMAPRLAPGCIVSDVGSVKLSVIRDVGPCLPEGVHFVPGHPIAGTEHSGPDAGFADLFENRYVILTPPPGSDGEAVARVKSLWEDCGAMVESMDAAHHDKVLAVTSHLPHLIAYTIVGTAFDLEASERQEVIRYSAGGFRDFTRIAGSDPVMWRDVFLNNREAVLEMLQRFSEDLTALQRAIRWGEGDTLEDLFRRTREIRRGVIEMRQAGTFDAREPDNPAPEDEPSQ